jgi:hypothetical protein
LFIKVSKQIREYILKLEYDEEYWKQRVSNVYNYSSSVSQNVITWKEFYYILNNIDYYDNMYNNQKSYEIKELLLGKSKLDAFTKCKRIVEYVTNNMNYAESMTKIILGYGLSAEILNDIAYTILTEYRNCLHKLPAAVYIIEIITFLITTGQIDIENWLSKAFGWLLEYYKNECFISESDFIESDEFTFMYQIFDGLLDEPSIQAKLSLNLLGEFNDMLKRMAKMLISITNSGSIYSVIPIQLK